MERRFARARSLVAATGGIVALFVGLAVIDERVRAVVVQLVHGRTAAPDFAGTQAQELVSVVFMAVKDQSLAHMPLVLFSATAIALVVFMLRT